MFGYILPFKPELKVYEYDTYKSFYCGLCHQLGSDFGPFSRLTLSYDFAFMSMFYSSIYSDESSITPRRCVANPLVKKPATNSDEYSQFCSYSAIILLYFKAKDNCYDSKWYKKPLYRLALLPMLLPLRKARKKYPELYSKALEFSKNQQKAEKEKTSIDSCADPTANFIAYLAGYFSKDNNERRILNRIGYFLGRYIYISDAFDDYKKDLKSNSFNPAVLIKSTDYKNYFIDVLNSTVAEIQTSYNLLELKNHKSIIDNFMYLGLSANVTKLTKKFEGETE